MQKEILDYYRSHSELSDPEKYANYYNDLPDSITELVHIIQNT